MKTQNFLKQACLVLSLLNCYPLCLLAQEPTGSGIKVITDRKDLAEGAAKSEFIVAWSALTFPGANPEKLSVPSSMDEIKAKHQAFSKGGMQFLSMNSGDGTHSAGDIIIVKKNEKLAEPSKIEMEPFSGHFLSISGKYWYFTSVVLLPIGSEITFKTDPVNFYGVWLSKGKILLDEQGIKVLTGTMINLSSVEVSSSQNDSPKHKIGVSSMKNGGFVTTETATSPSKPAEQAKKTENRTKLSEVEIEKILAETYERMKKDVNISHIFIACDQNTAPADTLVAFNKAVQIKKAIDDGGDFEQFAVENSDDKSAKTNKGNIGYVTPLLPDGFYPMEKAVYSAAPGSILGPVRTSKGYHVIRVNSFRPARGEMEIAHILIRKTNSNAKILIDDIHASLLKGARWEDLCSKHSEDKVTASKGGYIGFAGINRYQKAFEDAAFGLQKDGDISNPFETSIGWHIIKRISHRPVGSLEHIKPLLTKKVNDDSRSYKSDF